MRLFQSKEEWLRAIQHPKLIIIVTGIKKVMLENDLWERGE